MRQVVDVVHGAVNAQPDEPLAAHFVQHLLVFAFAPADQWGNDHHAAAFRQRQNLVHHLADRLRSQGFIVDGAARLAGTGEQQAQVVVDFSDRPHCGTRVMGRGFLFNGDGGGEPLHMVHVRFFHHGKELTSVGRERFDVAALAFGVECVEGQ